MDSKRVLLKERSVKNSSAQLASQVNAFDQNRDQVVSELTGCQQRILQILVPTLISVGLISIADRDKFALITLISSFAVLFGSGLYVSSLTYKIFRNGSYLRALDELNPATRAYSWESALNRFHGLCKPPRIMGYETTTIAVIYLVFSGAYFLMFYQMNLWLASGLACILALVAVRMFLLPAKAAAYHQHWQRVLQEMQDQESVQVSD